MITAILNKMHNEDNDARNLRRNYNRIHSDGEKGEIKLKIKIKVTRLHRGIVNRKISADEEGVFMK